MTLEGEYYESAFLMWSRSRYSRNPHDIGRRILLNSLIILGLILRSRNPHDIGRRILLLFFNIESYINRVAILMTLEGEYYH